MPSIPSRRIILIATVLLAIALPPSAACPPRKRNFADQPQPKAIRFAIAGAIDFDGDGTSDLPLMRQLIAAGGGVIDMELDLDGHATGRLRGDTAYLILGNIPPAANMPPGVARQFETLRRQAKERNLRVIQIDQLLMWGRQREWSEPGEFSLQFRARRPEGRNRGESAY